jgi:hypothetical protein
MAGLVSIAAFATQIDTGVPLVFPRHPEHARQPFENGMYDWHAGKGAIGLLRVRVFLREEIIHAALWVLHRSAGLIADLWNGA